MKIKLILASMFFCSVIFAQENASLIKEVHQIEFVETQLLTDSNGNYFLWNYENHKNYTPEIIVQKLTQMEEIENAIAIDEGYKIYIKPTLSNQELTSFYNRFFKL